LPLHRASFSIALVCAAALAVGGCKNSAQIFQDQNDGGWFSQDFFGKPDWARPHTAAINLGPQGSVAPEDLVSADGRCASPRSAMAQAEAPAGAAQAAATPGGLERLDSPSAPPVVGGIALGMTECQTVQRAGVPSNVAISANESGERKTVLTYLTGPWPGIYTFTGGRLSIVDAAPDQPKPAKTAPKKTPKKKPTT
jgi:hypothetical protein